MALQEEKKFSSKILLYFSLISLLFSSLVSYILRGDNFFEKIYLSTNLFYFVLIAVILTAFLILSYQGLLRAGLFAIIFLVLQYFLFVHTISLAGWGDVVFIVFAIYEVPLFLVTGFLTYSLGRKYVKTDNKNAKKIILAIPFVIMLVFFIVLYSTCAFDQDAVCVAKKAIRTNDPELCLRTWANKYGWEGGYKAEPAHKCLQLVADAGIKDSSRNPTICGIDARLC